MSSVRCWSFWTSPSKETTDYHRGPRGTLDWAHAHKNSGGEKSSGKTSRSFLLFGEVVIKFVRRPVGTRHHPRHRLPTVKSGTFAATVHSNFCGKEVGPFHHIEGAMDFKIYFNIMETVIKPYCPKWVHFTTGQLPKAQVEAAHQVVPQQHRPFAAVAIAVPRLKPYRRSMG
ncbi:hypothetical protein TELCIR_21627 [Teladorsagia circumcincta]|uniref:Uncharacterized protein n=1 Tax=Teladorsagia circumcincta TaxID=45464 RepID=A0A2G9THF8_TELCI|nr:hypothetical protein TELCIR_21627 [Teladorsagia circumcincta]